MGIVHSDAFAAAISGTYAQVNGNPGSTGAYFSTNAGKLRAAGTATGTNPQYLITASSQHAPIADMEVAQKVYGFTGTWDGGPGLSLAGGRYMLDVYAAGGSTFDIQRHTSTTGVQTSLGSATTTAPVDGDVISLRRVGNVFTAYKNGVQITTATDATYTGTAQGMLGQFIGAAVDYADDFTVDDLVVATTQQLHNRFRNDDGSEASATWAAAEDADLTIAAGTPVRLRTLIDTVGDLGSAAFEIRYDVNADGVFRKVLPTDPMLTAPTFQAAGTIAGGTGAISPAWPTHVEGDVALLLVESTGGQPATLTTANGFTAVTDSPQATGAGTNGTQLTAFVCPATSAGMSAPTVGDAGDHTIGVILTFRGVDPTNPVHVTAGAVKATASAAATAPTVTTTIANCLIVAAVSRDNDSAAAAFSAWANAALTGVAEVFDAGNTSGNGGGFGVATGVKAAVGATGSTTATVTSTINASMTIALRPIATPKVLLSASANVAAAGATATTPQLTPPATKTTADATPGRIFDDVNPPPNVDPAADDYVEFEASLVAVAGVAAVADAFRFRYYRDGGTVLTTYTDTPVLTVGGASNQTATPASRVLALAGASAPVFSPAIVARAPANRVHAMVTGAVSFTPALLPFIPAARVLAKVTTAPPFVPQVVARAPANRVHALVASAPVFSPAIVVRVPASRVHATVVSPPGLTPAGAVAIAPASRVLSIVTAAPNFNGGAGSPQTMTPAGRVHAKVTAGPAFTPTTPAILTPAVRVLSVVASNPTAYAGPVAFAPAGRVHALLRTAPSFLPVVSPPAPDVVALPRGLRYTIATADGRSLRVRTR